VIAQTHESLAPGRSAILTDLQAWNYLMSDPHSAHLPEEERIRRVVRRTYDLAHSSSVLGLYYDNFFQRLKSALGGPAEAVQRLVESRKVTRDSYGRPRAGYAFGTSPVLGSEWCVFWSLRPPKRARNLEMKDELTSSSGLSCAPRGSYACQRLSRRRDGLRRRRSGAAPTGSAAGQQSRKRTSSTIRAITGP
jgi:hypothetical protein